MPKHLFILLTLWFLNTNLITPAQARDDLKQVTQAAQRAIRRGDPRTAAILYLGALEKTHKRPKSRQRLLSQLLECSQLLAQKKQFPAAVELLSRLVEESKNLDRNLPIYTNIRNNLEQLALDLIASGKPQEANRALLALLKDGPGTALRWALLARSYLDQQAFRKARETIQRGLRLYPQSPELLFARATLAGVQSERAVARSNFKAAQSLLHRAEADLTKATSEKPDAAGIHRALGKIRASLWVFYRATGRYKKSLDFLVASEDAYEQAAQLDPTNSAIKLELADLLFAAQDWHWAEHLYEQILHKSKHTNKQTAQTQTPTKLQTQAEIENYANKRIIDCIFQRAKSAARQGILPVARTLAETIRIRAPAETTEIEDFVDAIDRHEENYQNKIADLESQPKSPTILALLGDLYLERKDYQQAEKLYIEATKLAESNNVKLDLPSRLFAVKKMTQDPLQLILGIGELEVRAAIPAHVNPSMIRTTMEKAHALTMGVFPHRLLGPVELTVYPNLRSFIEQAGTHVKTKQRGMYAYGRLMTYYEPERSQAEWLEILVHEMSLRYVDEMSYSRAPDWLAEGLARWAHQGWSHDHQRRFRLLAKEGLLVDWPEIETQIQKRWDRPEAQHALFLQAQQMVDWIMRRYGQGRLMTLLASFRQGAPLADAMRLALGADISILQKRWKQESF